MAQYNISSISFGGDTFILPSGGGGSSANVGDIRMIAGSTAPAKWMLCNGDVISRGTYSELFDVIGTAYGGGDGSTTFAIPSFQGRSPIGVGQNSTTGNTNHALGGYGGEEKHTLSVGELAQHSHTNSATTTGKYKKNAQSGSNTNRVDSDGSSSTSGPYKTTVTINNNGSNTSHNTMHPYVTINFIIYTGVA